MLTKGAISLVQENQEKRFLSNLLLVGERWELSVSYKFDGIEETYYLLII